MTPKEEYDLKRKSFISQAAKHFQFLVDDFGYGTPEYSFSEQSNGTIPSDEFKYENKSIDRAVSVSNAYHPYDYGFEVCFYRPSISSVHAYKKMVISVLKEEQDMEQTYMKAVAEKFKKDFLPVITGEKWID